MSMTDYISREAVLAKATTITEHFHAHGAEPDIVNHVVRVKDIAAILAADVVPVVRCKDCKHYKDGWCYNPNTCDDEKTRGNTVPDWYCADGERREATMEKPKCPYCGGEMELSRGRDGSIIGRYWYRCDNCDALAPEANSPEEAYSAAMKRKDNFDQLYERLRVRHGKGGKR